MEKYEYDGYPVDMPLPKQLAGGLVITRRDAQIIVAALEFTLRMGDVLSEADIPVNNRAGRSELERILRELGSGS